MEIAVLARDNIEPFLRDSGIAGSKYTRYLGQVSVLKVESGNGADPATSDQQNASLGSHDRAN